MNTVSSIVEKGRAGYPAIYLNTNEDLRTQADIKMAAKTLKRKLFVWTLTKGAIEDREKSVPLSDTEDPPGLLDALSKPGKGEIYILRLFHHHLDNPIVQARILDLIPKFKVSSRMLIVTAPVVKLPPEIEKEFTLVENVLPTREELNTLIDGIIEATQLPKELQPSPERRAELLDAALGLTMSEAENALTLSIIRPRIADPNSTNVWDPRIVMEEKCQALKRTGLLEYISVPEDGMKQVGGLENLKEWVRKRKKAFTEEAKKFGLRPPKGILLVGPSGCGKSLTAKAISGELHLPLLRLDMGKMFGSLVGQSEANIRQALHIAETMAPCILWIDEIEKGLAGMGGGSHDSGVGARVLGTILTWMQEKKSPVFVYATANDVSSLPPELLRKGRFDEIFSVSLPNRRERHDILRIQISQRNRGNLIANNKINLEELSGSISEGFTGAEIDAIVDAAMYAAFDVGKDLNNFDLREAFESTQPQSKTMVEKFEAIRKWCESRTRSANAPELPVQTSKSGRSIEA